MADRYREFTLKGIEATRQSLRGHLRELDLFEKEFRRKTKPDARVGAVTTDKPVRRKMSAAARRKLSQTMKARWAAKAAKGTKK